MPSYNSYGRRIRNLDKRIDKIQKEEELKWIDVTTVSGADDAIPSTGTLYLLNGSAAGVSPTSRIGAEIKVTSVHIRYHLHASTVPSFSPSVLRMVVLWDNQPNVALPTILRSVGTTGILDNTVVLYPPHSPFNHTVSDRFKILYDHCHVLQNNGVQDMDNADGDAEVMAIQGYCGHIKIKLGRKTKYITTSPGSGTISDIVTNALYLLAISNVSTTSANMPQLYFGSRVYFKDD